jgi:hypothetical protein
MSTPIKIKLGDLGEHHGVYHELSYSNDNYGGNQNIITFEIQNMSGNPLRIEYGYDGRVETSIGKNGRLTIEDVDDIQTVKIVIKGTYEKEDFLNMLRLILETEKMFEIVKP